MNDRLLNLLKPSRLTSVVDIGANPIDGIPPYLDMLEAGLCTLIGFEPQPEALQALQEIKSPLVTFLPHAIGDGAEHTLYLCAASGMTSLFKPNIETLRLFHDFPEYGAVVGEKKIQTRRLDAIDEIEAIDFLKMDVQGSELNILCNGRGKLKSAVAIQVEVSFIPLYENQPLFWQIDQELRAQGFIPHRLFQPKQLMIAPFLLNGNPKIGLHQVVEADIVYVRDFLRLDAMTAEQWKHLAIIAHHCYSSPDLALYALRSLAALGAIGQDVPQEYIGTLRPSDSSRVATITMADAPLPT
jgi:FkbM family methyltransferase